MMRRFQSIFFTLLLLCFTLPSMAQGTAEVWLNKAVEQFQNKGVEVVFRINEEGFNIGGKLLMEGNNYHFDTDEMKVWYDGTTQWTMQYTDDYSELFRDEKRGRTSYFGPTKAKVALVWPLHFSYKKGGQR